MSSNRLYLLSVLSGVLQTLGIALMDLTVSLGPAAPGMAIANANAVVVLALDQIFFHPSINAQQLAGLLVTIGGVGVLSVAPKWAGVTKVDDMATLHRPMISPEAQRAADEIG